jgi:hypothetical protein
MSIDQVSGVVETNPLLFDENRAPSLRLNDAQSVRDETVPCGAVRTEDPPGATGPKRCVSGVEVLRHRHVRAYVNRV